MLKSNILNIIGQLMIRNFRSEKLDETVVGLFNHLQLP